MQQPIVSVVVVAHDRARMVDALLRSLASQTERRFETIVLLNAATDEMREVVARHAADDPRVAPVVCDASDNASTARNRGVLHAQADLLYFLDDDTEVPESGIAVLVDLAARLPDVDVFGGPNLTPPDDPTFARVSGAVLASPLGTGPARSRYAATKARAAAERHLILCNLAVRRRVFDAGIAFPVLFGGEENTMMGRASHTGFRLWYAPELWVHHRRRRTLSGYVEQMVRYGRGRALAIRWAPGTLHVAFFAPVALAVYLVALGPLLTVTWLAWLPALFYAAAVFLAALGVAVHAREPTWLPLAAALFVITHLAYAWGLAATLTRLAVGGSGHR